MSKKGKHFGSNIVVSLFVIAILVIDIYILKSNILILFIPFVIIGVINSICIKCRNWTFGINAFFILSFFLLVFNINRALSNQYEHFGYASNITIDK